MAATLAAQKVFPASIQLVGPKHYPFTHTPAQRYENGIALVRPWRQFEPAKASGAILRACLLRVNTNPAVVEFQPTEYPVKRIVRMERVVLAQKRRRGGPGTSASMRHGVQDDIHADGIAGGREEVEICLR